MRNDQDAIKLIQKQFGDKTAVLATVCSGSTVLINAGLAKGRQLTGSPSIAIDLTNAGATYLDVAAHVDLQTGGAALVTGRSPGDLVRGGRAALPRPLLTPPPPQDSLHFVESIASALHAVAVAALAQGLRH